MLFNPQTIKTNFTARVGLRGLGVCFAAAFASSAVQIPGLLALTLEPSQPSPGIVVGLAWAGCVAGALVALGLWPLPLLALSTALYYFVMKAGQGFYAFQWDALLFETGVLSLFLAARSLPALAIWLPRLLLFRLMLRSGLVKLWSGDEAWASWTAMAYHFETQPLPGPLSWYAHHLPELVLKTLTAGTLLLELAVPWLIFLGRKPRLFAAAAIALLQLSIIATGNYGFFNVLTMVLCVFLLDDRFLRRGVVFSPPVLPWRRIVTALALPLSVHLGNSYGLFAVMTTERRELVIEGSIDGEVWKPYELPYKPGDVHRRPPFLLLHMPRLDWQLWFAALGDYRTNPWTLKLMETLLVGDERVTRLFAENPFPEKPPTFVRASFFLYRFTSPEERTEGRGWWRREALPPFLPPLSLKESSRAP